MPHALSRSADRNLARQAFRLAVLIAAPVLAPTAGLAQPPAPELGTWINHTGKGAVEIYMCGSSLCGKIVWLKEPNFENGKPKYDGHNPDPAKRKRPVCGLNTLYNLKRLQGGGWGSGTAYNPEEGKSYNVSIRLANANTLNVTGSVLFFSKTVVWKRATGELERCDGVKPAAPPPAPGIAAAPGAPPPAASPAKAKPVPAAAPAPPAAKPAATAAAPTVTTAPIAKPAEPPVAPANKITAAPAAMPAPAAATVKAAIPPPPVEPAAKTAPRVATPDAKLPDVARPVATKPSLDDAAANDPAASAPAASAPAASAPAASAPAASAPVAAAPAAKLPPPAPAPDAVAADSAAAPVAKPVAAATANKPAVKPATTPVLVSPAKPAVRPSKPASEGFGIATSPVPGAASYWAEPASNMTSSPAFATKSATSVPKPADSAANATKTAKAASASGNTSQPRPLKQLQAPSGVGAKPIAGPDLLMPRDDRSSAGGTYYKY